jgi:hypothetical protein
MIGEASAMTAFGGWRIAVGPEHGLGEPPVFRSRPPAALRIGEVIRHAAGDLGDLGDLRQPRAQQDGKPWCSN